MDYSLCPGSRSSSTGGKQVIKRRLIVLVGISIPEVQIDVVDLKELHYNKSYKHTISRLVIV
jgi:hypothetical protein